MELGPASYHTKTSKKKKEKNGKLSSSISRRLHARSDSSPSWLKKGKKKHASDSSGEDKKKGKRLDDNPGEEKKSRRRITPHSESSPALSSAPAALSTIKEHPEEMEPRSTPSTPSNSIRASKRYMQVPPPDHPGGSDGEKKRKKKKKSPTSRARASDDEHRAEASSSSNGVFPGQLPEDVLLVVLSFLRAKDRLKLRLVSMLWNTVCMNPDLWKAEGKAKIREQMLQAGKYECLRKGDFRVSVHAFENCECGLDEGSLDFINAHNLENGYLLHANDPVVSMTLLSGLLYGGRLSGRVCVYSISEGSEACQRTLKTTLKYLHCIRGWEEHNLLCIGGQRGVELWTGPCDDGKHTEEFVAKSGEADDTVVEVVMFKGFIFCLRQRSRKDIQCTRVHFIDKYDPQLNLLQTYELDRWDFCRTLTVSNGCLVVSSRYKLQFLDEDFHQAAGMGEKQIVVDDSWYKFTVCPWDDCLCLCGPAVADGSAPISKWTYKGEGKPRIAKTFNCGFGHGALAMKSWKGLLVVGSFTDGVRIFNTMLEPVIDREISFCKYNRKRKKGQFHPTSIQEFCILPDGRLIVAQREGILCSLQLNPSSAYKNRHSHGAKK